MNRSPRCIGIIGAVLALIGTVVATPSVVSAQQSWLDRPIEQWNTAGAGLPFSSQVEEAPPDRRCAVLARPAETAEDLALNRLGWRLVGSYQGGWGIRLVTATAGYDGMCRPAGYQVFVFVDGEFAGTVSPTPMTSRQDGAQDETRILSTSGNESGPELIGLFRRYAEGDAACCPSATSAVTYAIDRTADKPVLRVVRIVSPSGPARVPPAPIAATLTAQQWQWTSFTSPVESFTVDDPTRYQMSFMPDGRMAIQADCNRAQASYRSADSTLQITIGGTSRAACPPDSRGDQFLRLLGNAAIASIIEGELFIDLPADSGTLRFKPAGGR
jgi:heat shock protein HslJ